MNDLSFSWNSLGVVCSLAGGLRGCPSVAFCLARPKGQKQYKVMVNFNNTLVDLNEMLKNHPQTIMFLKKQGFFNQNQDITAFVLQEMQQDNWKARYSSKNQWTQSPWRVLPSKFFTSSPTTHKWYWTEVLAKRATPCPQDAWAVVLHDLLQSPPTQQGMRSASSIMKNFSLKRQSWESQSGQSLRFWAQGNEKWQAFLDKFDVSYRHSHNDTALVVWALANGWTQVFDGWQKETKLGLEFVPPFDELPEEWQNDNGQNGSLWHWACSFAPLSMIKSLVQNNDFDINTISPYGQTALHWACEMGNEEVVRFLMTLPSLNPGVEDQENKIPSELLPEQYNELFDELEALRLKKPPSCLEKQK